MKKINSRKTFLTLVIVVAGICTATAQETLANWTFVNWTGGAAAGVPAGQLLTDPIPANTGTQATTAKVGSEYMFADARVLGTEVIRPWGTPSAAGYVRTTLMIVGTYYRIIGLSTVNYTTIKVTAGFAADSSSRYYYLQLQYRDSSTGAWVSVGDPVFINQVAETTITAKFDNVQLPAAAEGVAALELRFLQTGFDPATNPTTTQSRIDNVLVTGVSTLTDVNKREANSIQVVAGNGKINIQGAEGLNATIYTVTGSKVCELKSLASKQEINASRNAIYIVNVAGKAFKVIM
jgi:hypothetical protein